MSEVTITDIARAAGVSPSTVSRALRDHHRISSERREAIQALAVKMGYRPSQVARSLVTGRTLTLGVVVTDVSDPYVAEAMKGAEAASRDAGYSLLFAMSNRDPGQEIAAVRSLIDRQVDGMIVISSRARERYERLLGPLPFVLVNNDQPGKHIYSVRTDNAAALRAGVRYLQGLGHRRIAYVAGPSYGRSSRERLHGFKQGMADGGLEAGTEFIFSGAGQPEDGVRALERMWASPEQRSYERRRSQRPSAVICYNDLTAIGLLGAAHGRGLAVPGDLSVLGYDNLPLSAYTVPPLTTFDQRTQLLGRRAVEMCAAALTGEDVSDVVLEADLVVRQSCGTPREP